MAQNYSSAPDEFEANGNIVHSESDSDSIGSNKSINLTPKPPAKLLKSYRHNTPTNNSVNVPAILSVASNSSFAHHACCPCCKNFEEMLSKILEELYILKTTSHIAGSNYVTVFKHLPELSIKSVEEFNFFTSDLNCNSPKQEELVSLSVNSIDSKHKTINIFFYFRNRSFYKLVESMLATE